jgi:hypothetical protein
MRRFHSIDQLFNALLTLLLVCTCCSAQITTDNPSPASSRWPMQIDTPDGQLTIYQPQPTKFDGDQLTGRAAVSLLKAGATDPVFGAIWMQSRVATDRVARTVQIIETTVTKVRFPEGTTITAEALTSALNAALPAHVMTLSLDQLLAMVEEVQQENKSVSEISDAPPKILFQTHPSVLLQYDGEPRFAQATGSPLQRAENTPFYVVQDPSSQTYFLKGAGRWFSARTPTGPFQMTGTVPDAVSTLADSSGYQDPEQPLSDQQASQLEIVAATEPTELVWTDGPIQMGTIPNTNLLYVMNTDSDVFRAIDSQAWYVLLSGRWYSAPNQSGPWAATAPDKLPDDFHRIPPASAKARVLASVAGTSQAQDAVADTYVPQTAAVDRKNFEQPPVTYDGDPQFQPIEGTQMQYAVNTPDSIILTGGQYYCCSNGVWYNCATPTGTWGLCTAVPAEIYTIPPSCPLFPCRYCYVYGVTGDFCYVGYTPGYTGCFRWNHVVVYGTGWRYHPWFGHHFYPRPFTYGFAAHYDPYTGFWGFSVGLRADDGAFWIGNGHRGGIDHGPFVRTGWFGHGGFRPPVMHRDIYAGRDVFERPGARPEEWNLYAQRHDVHPEFAPHNIRTGEIRSADSRVDIRSEPGHVATRMPAVERHEDLYADPNGNVYRRTDAGGWEQRQSDRWVGEPQANEHHEATAAEREPQRTESVPSESVRSEPQHFEQPREEEPALNRDYQARQFGEQRSQSYERSAPEPSRGGGGGFNGGGGGFNGGGQAGPHR